MRLFTATIAFLPRRCPPLEDLTLRSTRTTRREFERFGQVSCYHAQTELAHEPGLCDAVHPFMDAGEIIDYINGGLIHNWGVLLRRGFLHYDAEWVMFVSNDVLWHDGTESRINGLLNSTNRMTYFLGWPTAVFLMHRDLWDRLQPNWFDGYPPAGLDDVELACQVLAAGGEMTNDPLTGLFDHPVLSNTGTMLSLDRRGERPSNAPGCAEIFAKRWVPPMEFEPNSESVQWPPQKSQVDAIRACPKRPYP